VLSDTWNVIQAKTQLMRYTKCWSFYGKAEQVPRNVTRSLSAGRFCSTGSRS